MKIFYCRMVNGESYLNMVNFLFDFKFLLSSKIRLFRKLLNRHMRMACVRRAQGRSVIVEWDYTSQKRTEVGQLTCNEYHGMS